MQKYKFDYVEVWGLVEHMVIKKYEFGKVEI